MIKSNILKKIATIAVTASLAIGGSLLGAAPAHATGNFTITYNSDNADGGTVPASTTGLVPVAGNTGNLTKGPYTFLGWKYMPQNGYSYLVFEPGDTINISQAITLTAVWGAPVTTAIMYSPTRLAMGTDSSGYTLSGWPNASDYSVTVNGASVAFSAGVGGGNLVLTNPVSYGDTVTVSYTADKTRYYGTDIGSDRIVRTSVSNLLVNTTTHIPHISGTPTFTDQGFGSARISFTSSTSNGYTHYAVLPAASPAPSSSGVLAGTVAGAIDSGQSSIWSTSNFFNVNGLTANTNYKVYIVYADNNLNASNMVNVTVSIAATNNNQNQNQNQNQNMTAGTVQTAPGTPSVTNGVANVTLGTWLNPSLNQRSNWVICDSPHTAGSSASGGTYPSDCKGFSLTPRSLEIIMAWDSTRPLTIPATVHKFASCNNQGRCSTEPVSTVGKFLAWYERDISPYQGATSVWAISATVATDGSGPVVEEEPEAPLLDSLGRPARTQGKTPAFVKSVVKDIAASLAAIKPIHASANQPANGGVIKLETESLGTVSKVLIGDTEVKTDLKDGVISFTSPLVKVPTDLTITASIGTLIFDDAIKPIATLKSVLVPVTSGNVNKITDETIQVLNSVLLADSKATNVTCTATASANNGVAKAAARAAALAACGYLTNVAQDMVAEIVVKVDTTAARNNKATKLTFEVSK